MFLRGRLSYYLSFPRLFNALEILKNKLFLERVGVFQDDIKIAIIGRS